MSDYIKLFETVNEYNEARNNDYYEPWVGYTIENSGVSFNKTKYEKLLGTPVTFKVISAGTINWAVSSTAFAKTIEYSTDNGETWTSITSNTGASAPSISVNSGDTVQFRGNNATYSNGIYYHIFSGSTAKFELEGNIMSLIDSTGYTTATTLASSYTFYFLFGNCTGLTSADNLVLPATTLTQNCYNYMLYGCTSLTIAPELPATTLATSCYQGMFEGCTNLTTAPSILPATTLVQSCYSYMFRVCTSLTTAPELPAATLASGCYNNMFSGCTSLNYIKCLAIDISVSNCTTNWVSNVASTGTFVKDVSMTGWTTGNDGIPANWTVEDAF